jgi:hypothetical protein
VQLAHDLGERVVDGDGDGDALAREFGTAAPTLVVRPHPTNPAPFKAFSHPASSSIRMAAIRPIRPSRGRSTSISSRTRRVCSD